MIRTVKKPDVRRQEIMDAAKELFLSKGYDNSTMQDIMQKLEIAKGTIYHYFKSKEDLLEAVVKETVDEYIVGLQVHLDKVKGNAVERMRALIESSSVASNQKETIAQLHLPGNISMHTRLLAVTISGLAPLYAKVIEQGVEEGIFKVKHPLEAAELLLAGIQFLTDVGCYPWSQKELLRRAKAFPDLIEGLLNAAKGSFNFLLKRKK